MNNQKAINTIFFYLAFAAFILAIFILVILVATFYNESKGVHIEIWAKNYASLISALGIILASALASFSVQRTIINSLEIEEKKKMEAIKQKTSHVMYILINIHSILVYYEGIIIKLKATYYTNDEGVLPAEVLEIYSELNNVVSVDYDLLSRIEIPNGMDDTKLNQLLEVLFFVQSNLRKIKAVIKLVSTVKVNEETVFDSLTDILESTSEKINSISDFTEK